MEKKNPLITGKKNAIRRDAPIQLGTSAIRRAYPSSGYEGKLFTEERGRSRGRIEAGGPDCKRMGNGGKLSRV